MSLRLILSFILVLIISPTLLFSDAEPNDTCADAELLMQTAYEQSGFTSGSVNGAVHDIYKVEVNFPGTLTLTLENTDGTQKIRYDSGDLPSSCSVPASLPDTLNQGNTDTITQVITTPGTYYFYMYEWSQASNRDADYEITTTFTPDVSHITEGDQDFALEERFNIFGDMKLIGNTVMWKPGAADPTARNNSYDMEFVDIDGNASTFNSSSATLDWGGQANDIVWAGLYWQGHICKEGAIGGCNNSNSFPGASDTAEYNSAVNAIPSLRFTLPNNTTKTLVADKVAYIEQNSGDRTLYSSYIDVTPLVSGEGTYSVSNLSTSEGQIGTWGGFGGWALLVVYEDPTRNLILKNISVFEGFKAISGGNVDIPITGFYTPTDGIINATASTFVADGDLRDGNSNTWGEHFLIDANNTGSYQDIFDAANPFEDVFNSSTTDMGVDTLVRNPNHINNLGLDINTFDISSKIAHGQQDTTLRLNTSGDLYFIDLVVFTADLYQPKVCYLESILIDGVEYNTSAQVDIGSEVTYKVTVKNDSNATAEGITVQTVTAAVLDYEENSIEIAPVGSLVYAPHTDALMDDEAEYNLTTTNMLVYLGAGADGTTSTGGDGTGTGGDMLANETTMFQYTTVLFANTDNNETNTTYSVSYTDSTLGISFNGLQMNTCDGSGSGISINPYSVPVDGISIDDDHTALGIIQTKIVNKPFTVEASYLNDGVHTPWPADFALPIIVFKLDDSCVKGQTLDPYDYFTTIMLEPGETFAESDLVDINTSSRVSFLAYSFFNYDDLFSGDAGISCVNHSTTTGNISGIPQCLNAVENFEEFFDGNVSALACLHDPATGLPCSSAAGGYGLPPYDHEFGCLACVLDNDTKECSDSFSVRPDSFTLDLTTLSPADPSTLLRSGQEYDITVSALVFGATTPAPGYDQTTVANDFNLTASAVKRMPDGTINAALNGTAYHVSNSTFIEGEAIATPVNFTFDDVGKITLDLNDTKWAIVDQDDTPFNDRVIHGEANVTFIPWDFNITAATLTNNNTGGQPFTYFSADMTMSAKIPLTLRAQNMQGGVTQNYADTLYDKPITMSVAVTGMPGLTPLSAGLVNQDLPFTLGQTVIAAADLTVLSFNFNRDTNNTLNPRLVTGADIDMTATDTDGVTGTEATDAAGSIPFYYGRLHAPRTRIAGNTGNAVLDYEIYCFGTDSTGTDCNVTLRDNVSNGLLSEDDVRWYKNAFHTAADGNVTLTAPKNGFTNITENAIANGATSVINYTYTGDKGYPYKTTMQVINSPWLRWNRFTPDPLLLNDYELEFNRAGNWGGQDNSNAGVDSNASNNSSRRLNW